MNIIKSFHKIFFLTMLLGFLLPELLAQKGDKEANPLARLEAEILAFESKDKEFPEAEGAILFVGSSSVRFWGSLKKDVHPLRVINRGFGGSTFPELLYYYDRIVKPYKPKGIVVYEGDNDLVSPEMTPEIVLDNLKKFMARVNQDFPEAKVWFIAIKPSIARVDLLGKMQRANALIQNYAQSDNKLEYLDVASPMLNQDGTIMSDIFIKDNLHMNPKGYEIWKSVIRPALVDVYQVESSN